MHRILVVILVGLGLAACSTTSPCAPVLTRDCPLGTQPYTPPTPSH